MPPSVMAVLVTATHVFLCGKTWVAGTSPAMTRRELPGERDDRSAGAEPMSEELTAERVQELISRAPYHQWLGLKVMAVHEDGIELTAAWRAEWVVNPERRYTHGGVLAALVDLAADWAMVRRTGRGVPAVDLRVAFHPAGVPGDLVLRGKIVRMGGQFSTAEAQIFDQQGKLLASGRGTYFTAPPKG